MTVTVWVPRDAGALAVGAEATARKLVAAARDAGVRWIYQLLQPDSTLPAHAVSPGMAGIDALADLMP